MSMAPNNPFENSQNDQVFGESPAPKKSGKGCLIGCGIAGLVCVLLCCGGVLMFGQFISTTLATEYQRQLEGNPVVVEHIGEIDSLDVDWMTTWSKTMEEAEKQQQGQQGSDAMLVFNIEGSKGSGQIILVPDEGGGDGPGMNSAKLVMPDGSEYPIATGVEEMEDLDLEGLIDSGDLDTGDAGEPETIEVETN
jgi:hypothetical protein